MRKATMQQHIASIKKLMLEVFSNLAYAAA